MPRGSRQADIFGAAAPIGNIDTINDYLVRKTRRLFKADWFSEDQLPYQHLEAERLAHLNQQTYYSSANQATRMQIDISMMSNKLMLHAQELCETCGPFVDVGDFLKAFRDDRFPNFGPQCEELYKNCFQKASKSTRQYASCFKDICAGNSKDPNMFVDDFIKRMRTYTTKKAILTTLYDQGGRTLERVTHYAEQVEIFSELHE
jgi:hypothetical protein